VHNALSSPSQQNWSKRSTRRLAIVEDGQPSQQRVRNPIEPATDTADGFDESFRNLFGHLAFIEMWNEIDCAEHKLSRPAILTNEY
jgi:hypothetical protein